MVSRHSHQRQLGEHITRIQKSLPLNKLSRRVDQIPSDHRKIQIRVCLIHLFHHLSPLPVLLHRLLKLHITQVQKLRHLRLLRHPKRPFKSADLIAVLLPLRQPRQPDVPAIIVTF